MSRHRQSLSRRPINAPGYGVVCATASREKRASRCVGRDQCRCSSAPGLRSRSPAFLQRPAASAGRGDRCACDLFRSRVPRAEWRRPGSPTARAITSSVSGGAQRRSPRRRPHFGEVAATRLMPRPALRRARFRGNALRAPTMSISIGEADVQGTLCTMSWDRVWRLPNTRSVIERGRWMAVMPQSRDTLSLFDASSGRRRENGALVLRALEAVLAAPGATL